MSFHCAVARRLIFMSCMVVRRFRERCLWKVFFFSNFFHLESARGSNCRSFGRNKINLAVAVAQNANPQHETTRANPHGYHWDAPAMKK